MKRAEQEYRVIYLPTGREVKRVMGVSERSAKIRAGYHNWDLHVVKPINKTEK